MDNELTNKNIGQLPEDISKLLSKSVFLYKKQLENWIKKDKSHDEEKFIKFHKKCSANTIEKFEENLYLLSYPDIAGNLQEILERRLKSVFEECHDTFIIGITKTEQRLEAVRKRIVDFYLSKMLKRLTSNTYIELEESHKVVINQCVRKLLHIFPSDLVKQKFLHEMQYICKVLNKEFVQVLQRWKTIIENEEEEDQDLEAALKDLFAEDGLVEITLKSREERSNEPTSLFYSYWTRQNDSKNQSSCDEFVLTISGKPIVNQIFKSPKDGFNALIQRLSYASSYKIDS